MDKTLKLALINSGIAAGLTFLGAFADGVITANGLVAALSAGGIIFLTKMRTYVKKIQNKKGTKGRLFEFI